MRPKRVSIPDTRGHGGALRVTRHPEHGKIVLSHWRDGLCVASTPIDLTDVPELIGVLADALGDALADPTGLPSRTASRSSVFGALRGWFRPTLAQVTELNLRRAPRSDHGVG